MVDSERLEAGLQIRLFFVGGEKEEDAEQTCGTGRGTKGMEQIVGWGRRRNEWGVDCMERISTMQQLAEKKYSVQGAPTETEMAAQVGFDTCIGSVEMAQMRES